MSAPLETKWCSACLTHKDVEEFGRRKRTHDGRSLWCKPCWRDYAREYRKRCPERTRAASNRYYAFNREKVLAKQRDRYQKIKAAKQAEAAVQS